MNESELNQALDIMTSPSYMNTTEMSKVMKITRNQITKLCATGRLIGAIKLGRTWYIPKTAPSQYKRCTPGPKPKSQS